uniref:Methionine aminopeptidase n=1 Tax=Lepeophtheirus salmonis TaxID=72036 RepID=C1BST2_LEPSM|nr:Methionine aminopeptidase 1 [Lepeophtheirus salmonis]
MSERICETVGCNKPASLQCPNCIKLGLGHGTFFCSQDCFKSSWNTHKLIHKRAKEFTYNPWPRFKFTGNLRPFPQTPKRLVPEKIPRPDYAVHPDGIPLSETKMKGNTYVRILDEEEIEALRVSCRLGRQVLDEAAAVVDAGVTTEEIDRVVHEACIERDCYPSPLGYYNFPKSCCTSVNEVICHGIPDKRVLEKGDIVNVDVTVFHRGFHGDLNETLFAGEPTPTAKALVLNTWECLDKAIKECVKPGVKYREVGNVIQKHAGNSGYSVVRGYCGHGIHRLFHCAPNVPHYAKNKAVGFMKPGHAFTIEPMISEGVWSDQTWPDSWTAVTTDGKLSAQFEQTMVVTSKGADVLAARLGKPDVPYFLDPK